MKNSRIKLNKLQTLCILPDLEIEDRCPEKESTMESLLSLFRWEEWTVHAQGTELEIYGMEMVVENIDENPTHESEEPHLLPAGPSHVPHPKRLYAVPLLSTVISLHTMRNVSRRDDLLLVLHGLAIRVLRYDARKKSWSLRHSGRFPVCGGSPCAPLNICSTFLNFSEDKKENNDVLVLSTGGDDIFFLWEGMKWSNELLPPPPSLNLSPQVTTQHRPWQYTEILDIAVIPGDLTKDFLCRPILCVLFCEKETGVVHIDTFVMQRKNNDGDDAPSVSLSVGPFSIQHPGLLGDMHRIFGVTMSNSESGHSSVLCAPHRHEGVQLFGTERRSELTGSSNEICFTGVDHFGDSIWALQSDGKCIQRWRIVKNDTRISTKLEKFRIKYDLDDEYSSFSHLLAFGDCESPLFCLWGTAATANRGHDDVRGVCFLTSRVTLKEKLCTPVEDMRWQHTGGFVSIKEIPLFEEVGEWNESCWLLRSCTDEFFLGKWGLRLDVAARTESGEDDGRHGDICSSCFGFGASCLCLSYDADRGNQSVFVDLTDPSGFNKKCFVTDTYTLCLHSLVQGSNVYVQVTGNSIRVCNLAVDRVISEHVFGSECAKRSAIDVKRGVVFCIFGTRDVCGWELAVEDPDTVAINQIFCESMVEEICCVAVHGDVLALGCWTPESVYLINWRKKVVLFHLVTVGEGGIPAVPRSVVVRELNDVNYGLFVGLADGSLVSTCVEFEDNELLKTKKCGVISSDPEDDFSTTTQESGTSSPYALYRVGNAPVSLDGFCIVCEKGEKTRVGVVAVSSYSCISYFTLSHGENFDPHLRCYRLCTDLSLECGSFVDDVSSEFRECLLCQLSQKHGGALAFCSFDVDNPGFWLEDVMFPEIHSENVSVGHVEYIQVLRAILVILLENGRPGKWILYDINAGKCHDCLPCTSLLEVEELCCVCDTGIKIGKQSALIAVVSQSHSNTRLHLCEIEKNLRVSVHDDVPLMSEGVPGNARPVYFVQDILFSREGGVFLVAVHDSVVCCNLIESHTPSLEVIGCGHSPYGGVVTDLREVSSSGEAMDECAKEFVTFFAVELFQTVFWGRVSLKSGEFEHLSALYRTPMISEVSFVPQDAIFVLFDQDFDISMMKLSDVKPSTNHTSIPEFSLTQWRMWLENGEWKSNDEDVEIAVEQLCVNPPNFPLDPTVCAFSHIGEYTTSSCVGTIGMNPLGTERTHMLFCTNKGSVFVLRRLSLEQAVEYGKNYHKLLDLSNSGAKVGEFSFPQPANSSMEWQSWKYVSTEGHIFRENVIYSISGK